MMYNEHSVRRFIQVRRCEKFTYFGKRIPAQINKKIKFQSVCMRHRIEGGVEVICVDWTKQMYPNKCVRRRATTIEKINFHFSRPAHIYYNLLHNALVFFFCINGGMQWNNRRAFIWINKNGKIAVTRSIMRRYSNGSVAFECCCSRPAFDKNNTINLREKKKLAANTTNENIYFFSLFFERENIKSLLTQKKMKNMDKKQMKKKTIDWTS